jgi:hypothetical protein
VGDPKSSGMQTATMVHAGAYTVTVSDTPTANAHLVGLSFAVRGGEGAARGYAFTMTAGSTHTVVVTTDPVKHLLVVSMGGLTRFSRTLHNEDPVRVDPSTSRPNESRGALTVTDVTSGTARPTLCRSLIH